MEYAQPGDTIVIWKLDRLERSTIKLIELIEELKNKGVNLKSLSESIDTSTATGNLFFSIYVCVGRT
nr:recombinase family protein [Dyadobacter sp. 3J3]